MTNGDYIRAIIQANDIWECHNLILDIDLVCVKTPIASGVICFHKTWWDSELELPTIPSPNFMNLPE